MADFIDLKRKALARYLRRHIQGEVRFDPISRQLYSTDASIYQIEPLGVIIPRTVDDLQTAVQVAAEMRIPIIARGGGTSLSGQSIGPGMVVDCSKYLNNILEVDPQARRVRVQPGVVLDQLNRALAGHGLQFGPDVATASRANIGGMIGNNSAGSRSIVYGKTIDHVCRLKVVLSDGSRAEFAPMDPMEWDRRAACRSIEGTIYRTVRDVVREHGEEIRRRFPRIPRRVSGYNLDALCKGLGVQAHWAQPVGLGAQPGGFELQAVGLESLIVGSEGTLGVVAEAELGLVRCPKARGLLVLHFASLAAAMDALAACLEFGPSAVELMDQKLLDLARNNLSLKDTMATVKGRPAALFLVEFSGDDEAEVANRVHGLQQGLRQASGVTDSVPALDPSLRDPLWNLRRAALPLLMGLPGDRKPVAFVEDAAVAPQRLPEFVGRFRQLLRQHGTEGAFYGHASVGCLHIRPILNLKDQGDVARMRQIAGAVTDLVLEFGGALSGEHGDGLARSEWNQKMFGPVIYQAFRRVKQAFDPNNLLNPGKIVHAPAMTENLRYSPAYQPAEPSTLFDYSRQEGFVRSIELCNGSGVCRKLQGGTMCPSFRATRDEKDSTRGRANALRLALAGQEPIKALRSRPLYDVLDLCLMCKACKAECPSNVDMAKLKSEFLHFYYAGRSRPLGQVLMAQIHRWNRYGAAAAPLVNWLQKRRVCRWLLEKTAGIDRRRSLPSLRRRHFRRWFARHKPAPSAGRLGRVLLMDDCFTTFSEPEIGRAAVAVLERAGYRVELAGLTCCGRPMISKGFLQQSRDLIQGQLLPLARRLAAGTPLLGLEPSCLLTLADEWPELVPADESKRVAAAAILADGWLAQQIQAGRCELPLAPLEAKCLLHGHCHQKALVGVGGAVAALHLVPELDVTALDAGCCGMAGAFGFEKEHYDLSVAIANLALVPALAAEPEAMVVAPGTSCRHQIKDLTGRRAWHPLEVLAKQLANGLVK